MRSRFQAAFLSGLILFGVLILPGCGGDSQSGSPQTSGTQNTDTAASGRAMLSVRWPERAETRLIPVAANSVRVRLTSLDGARLFGEALLVRPASGGLATASFERLPVGPLRVAAAAHPGADGAGVSQASAQTQATILAGQIIDLRLTLASTIDRLEASPDPLTVGIGGQSAVSVTARNTAGEVVVFTPSLLSFTSRNPAVAAVNAGQVRGVATGSTTVDIREEESGKSVAVRVGVSPSSSGNVKCNPQTGHCYEQIRVPQDSILFAAIRDLAAARVYQGLPGHLATITSQAEMDFLRAEFSLLGCTIGAFQDRTAPDFGEPGGGYRWVTGEPWGFTAWNGGEPNNVGGGEDYISHFANENWNDGYNGDWTSYMVEYEFAP